MSDHQPWLPDSVHVDEAQVTVAALAGPLPSGVHPEAFVSGNGSRLTDDEIHRLILENPFLLKPSSSNFDHTTQVQHYKNTLASLGLGSPGAATDGVTPIFPKKN